MVALPPFIPFDVMSVASSIGQHVIIYVCLREQFGVPRKGQR